MAAVVPEPESESESVAAEFSFELWPETPPVPPAVPVLLGLGLAGLLLSLLEAGAGVDDPEGVDEEAVVGGTMTAGLAAAGGTAAAAMVARLEQLLLADEVTTKLVPKP